MPRNASGVTFSTRIDSPAKVTVLPTERSDANARSSRTGNFRSSRIRSVISPAAPVAPTTATRCPAIASSGHAPLVNKRAGLVALRLQR